MYTSVLSLIEFSAFEGCIKLKSISIPSCVQEIKDNAFYLCRNLESIIFEEESILTKIGSYIFSHCVNLKTIKLPYHLEGISSHSFE